MKNREQRRAFVKEFFTLALPIASGNLFTFGASFASHLMTASLGREALAGIFLSNQVMQLLAFAVSGIEAVVTVLGAQALGEGDKDRFIRVAIKAAALAFFISISLTILCITMPKSLLSVFSESASVGSVGASYLRTLSIGFPLYSLSRVLIAAAKAGKRASVALKAPLISFILTVLLGLLLIRGPFGLGAVGAGLSATLARAAELGAVVLSLLGRGRIRGAISLIRGALRSLLSPEPAFRRTLLPIMAGQIAWGAETLLVTSLMSRFAGGEAAASFGVLSALSNLAYVLMSGASGAVGVMISRLVGGGGGDSELRPTVKLSERTFLAVGVIGAILILLLTAPFAKIYRLSEGDALILFRLAPILALTFIAAAYSASALFGIIKSGGDLKFVLAVDLFSLLFITLPISLAVYSSGLGIAEFYTATRLVHLFKCPIAYSRVISGSWAKRLTKPKESGKISI